MVIMPSSIGRSQSAPRYKPGKNLNLMSAKAKPDTARNKNRKGGRNLFFIGALLW
jgi:hypothetical protein